jgi:hypothetical protein
MRKNRIVGVIFGIVLGIFCIGLIAASIHIQLVQSKEQSPIYQQRIILQEHVKNFAIDLSGFAKNYDQNKEIDSDALRDVYYPEINSYRGQLYAEGVRSTNLANLFEKHRNVRTTAEMLTNLNDMAVEFGKMADRLTTPSKNP